MDYKEGKEEFIKTWGQLATNWGVSRTKGQVHALLLISCDPLCLNDIIESLDISRGNAHQNIHALLDWGLVHKKDVDGDRKEYYVAEKDMWVVMRSVIQHRKKKELEPLIEVLKNVSTVKPGCEDAQEFSKLVHQLYHLSTKANKTLDTIISLESDEIIQRMFFSTQLDQPVSNPSR